MLRIGPGSSFDLGISFPAFFLLPLFHFVCEGIPSPQDFAAACTCLKKIRDLGDPFSVVLSAPCSYLLAVKTHAIPVWRSSEFGHSYPCSPGETALLSTLLAYGCTSLALGVNCLLLLLS